GSRLEEGKTPNGPASNSQSSILDSQSSVVDVPSGGQDGERERNALVVSSRRAPSPLSISPGGRGRGEGALVPAELSQSIALIISNQFAEMRRHMFDQFQQAWLVMFQTFSLLHRDQIELARQETNRVHALTRRSHDLTT